MGPPVKAWCQAAWSVRRISLAVVQFGLQAFLTRYRASLVRVSTAASSWKDLLVASAPHQSNVKSRSFQDDVLGGLFYYNISESMSMGEIRRSARSPRVPVCTYSARCPTHM